MFCSQIFFKFGLFFGKNQASATILLIVIVEALHWFGLRVQFLWLAIRDVESSFLCRPRYGSKLRGTD